MTTLPTRLLSVSIVLIMLITSLYLLYRSMLFSLPYPSWFCLCFCSTATWLYMKFYCTNFIVFIRLQLFYPPVFLLSEFPRQGIVTITHKCIQVISLSLSCFGGCNFQPSFYLNFRDKVLLLNHRPDSLSFLFFITLFCLLYSSTLLVCLLYPRRLNLKQRLNSGLSNNQTKFKSPEAISPSSIFLPIDFDK